MGHNVAQTGARREHTRWAAQQILHGAGRDEAGAGQEQLASPAKAAERIARGWLRAAKTLCLDPNVLVTV